MLAALDVGRKRLEEPQPQKCEEKFNRQSSWGSPPKAFGNVVAGFSPRRRHCNIVETRAKARDYILSQCSQMTANGFAQKI
jgi:hypothetical protein